MKTETAELIPCLFKINNSNISTLCPSRKPHCFYCIMILLEHKNLLSKSTKTW